MSMLARKCLRLRTATQFRFTSSLARSGRAHTCAPRALAPRVLPAAAAAGRRALHGSAAAQRAFNPSAVTANAPRPIRKVMAANRGEIATRIFRAGTECDIATVAIYSKADEQSAHRYKADQAFQVGADDAAPVAPYLSVAQIVAVAKENGVDAIHPGYGFLSESAEFARACGEAGIQFVGPRPETIALLGDKVQARALAARVGVPTIAGSETAVASADEVRALVDSGSVDYPIMLKAAHGGGGRGMRVVHSSDELDDGFRSASSEAEAAFGNGEMFVERFVAKARHIEIQVIGDEQGNVVHLFERDCSVQRRNQKVVEMAPAPALDDALRQQLFDDALKIAREAKYVNAGTVEFLIDTERNQHYFIEVNTRLQVEHTVTEEITGVDLVQAQFAVASGKSLADIGIGSQADISQRGFAIQCRVTTEDPDNDFAPDTGHIIAYRDASGMGIRLDGANGFAGAYISPYFDSLLVKVTAHSLTFEGATRKLARALAEFRVRGLSTNLGFVKRLLEHEEFASGGVTTDFIARNSAALRVGGGGKSKNRAGRVLDYLSYITVNGPLTPLGLPDVKIPRTKPPTVRTVGPPRKETPLKHILDKEGPDAFARAVRARKDLLVTDTTMRDAHQSLLATRVRTYDLLNVAPQTAKAFESAYSLEVWGGATFDVAMRFLFEDPWERLRELRAAAPDVPLQMLLRGANAVGYTAYPDNVVDEFVRVAAEEGIDVFRVFDSLNDVDNMRLGAAAVRRTPAVLEAAISYTGLQDTGVYTLDYYMELARQFVEELQCHVLCIKDMAGLLTPSDATLLVGSLRKRFPDMPIHVHTHDTAGTGVANMLACARAGADAVDGAVDSMSGVTSQPSIGALLAAAETDDSLDINLTHRDITALSEYWDVVRGHYAPFESATTMKASDSSVYEHQIPGGQLSNLHFQSHSLGLGDRFAQVKKSYIDANRLLGSPPKVTPSSKVVGDLAQFLTTNNLTPADVVEKASELNFPSSVVDYMRGGLGTPPGGFPEPLRSQILRGEKPYDGRPGATMAPVDFEQKRQELEKRHPKLAAAHGITQCDVLSALMYPAEFEKFADFRAQYTGAVWKLPTWAFWRGLQPGDSLTFALEHGKNVSVGMSTMTQKPTPDGHVQVFMTMNGTPRTVYVPDDRVQEGGASAAKKRKKASPAPSDVPAPMPGTIVEVNVAVGEKVKKGQKLCSATAMKMNISVSSQCDGTVKEILIDAGDLVASQDLLMVIEPSEE